MFMHIRCIFGRASCSLVAMLGNLSRPWTMASDQHEAKQARMYDNITMKPTQASKKNVRGPCKIFNQGKIRTSVHA